MATAVPTGQARGFRLLGNAVLALALVGFPVAAATSQLAGFASSDLNVAYRALMIFLSIVLFVWSIARRGYRMDPLVGFFFVVYSLRLLADFQYSSLPNIGEDAIFFLATVVIPTLSIGSAREWFNEKTFLMLTLMIGAVGASLIAVVLATGGATSAITNYGDTRATIEFLNPISIGYQGLFASIAGFLILARYRSQVLILPCLFAIALGGYLLVSSGSRGPFVALVVALAVTGAASRGARAAYVVAGSFVGAAIAYFGLPDAILNRFRDIGSDASALDRIYAMELSFEAMLDHPLLGYAYIEPVTGLYPHNLLIEAGLALGLLGLFLMLWLQASLVWNAWCHAQRREWALPLLAVIAFTNSWISGALWGSTMFFMMAWILRTRPPDIKMQGSNQTENI
jgi:O-antigen ligase